MMDLYADDLMYMTIEEESEAAPETEFSPEFCDG